MDIEPLLVRLETLAPGFGRAQHDIMAMVSRGRSEDYKGVMQNCRLVLEALLRALVADHLKQTPGKAMLDELITKFRQQANAGVIPTNILAHMGTVQAWGNLSSHDHATKLTDDGVTVGKGEVMASLNSMVAILDWYSKAFGDKGAAAAAIADKKPIAVVATKSAPLKKSSPVVPIVIGVVVLAGAAAGYVATRPAAAIAPPPTPIVEPIVEASPFVALDALYTGWKVPLPPGPCRSPKDAKVLAANPKDISALEALPANRSAEAWYLIGRAQFDQKLDAKAAAAKAAECPRFAAAFNLAGNVAVVEKRFDDALASFNAALDTAPDFHNARFNLGMLHLTQGRLAEGEKELKRLTAADPKYGDAHFGLGMYYHGQKRLEEAKASFCLAVANGSQIKMAKTGCEN